MVYTAGNQSLAMPEMLVQVEPLRANYIMIPAKTTHLLNPDHPAFAKTEISIFQPFITDLNLMTK